MIIRRALKTDLSGINVLLRQVLDIHYNGRPDIFKANTKKYSDQELLSIFSDEQKPVFVAEENGDILGYAFCVLEQYNSNVLNDIKTLYIDDLCVEQNCRGRHIGSKLYEYVLNFAKQEGCYNITLNVWHCNEPALRFYEKLGFAPQKTTMEKCID